MRARLSWWLRTPNSLSILGTILRMRVHWGQFNASIDWHHSSLFQHNHSLHLKTPAKILCRNQKISQPLRISSDYVPWSLKFQAIKSVYHFQNRAQSKLWSNNVVTCHILHHHGLKMFGPVRGSLLSYKGNCGLVDLSGLKQNCGSPVQPHSLSSSWPS